MMVGGLTIEVVRWRDAVSPRTGTGARLILEIGRKWSDWPTTEASSRHDAYSTLFDVYYEGPESPSDLLLLGSVKILQRARREPEIQGVLSTLPEDFCSLGQTIDYYEAIESLGERVGSAVLAALRDVTADEEIARSFEEEPGFRESLLRFSEAALMFYERPKRLHREVLPTDELTFRFSATLAGFDAPHELEFHFAPEPKRLGRLTAIVGRNGTGKTQLLARLAQALWGLHRTGEELHPPRPPIGRVIAVSYSALDAFDRPPHRMPGHEERRAFDSYCYCGFRAPDDAVRPAIFFELLGRDLEEIRRRGRRPLWQKMLGELRLLEEEPLLDAALVEGDHLFVERARRLSAGGKTALSVLTRLLAVLRHRAFVLFDEPELNLHPSLLAGVLRVLHDWLERFDGYGVLATHSPVVLQEIPGRYVRVLDFDLSQGRRVPFVRPYESESFGQNLSEIVVSVFGIREDDRNYASILEGLVAEGRSVEEIEAAFGRPLSLSARMALRYLDQRRRQT
jgi:ABC-type transport system involved in cytochrome c biogenesis ATPase subunit